MDMCWKSPGLKKNRAKLLLNEQRAETLIAKVALRRRRTLSELGWSTFGCLRKDDLHKHPAKPSVVPGKASKARAVHKNRLMLKLNSYELQRAALTSLYVTSPSQLSSVS
jgi:hypothetical protein